MDGEKEVKAVEVLSPVDEMVKQVLSYNEDASTLLEKEKENAE
jgi:hypothetical protein